MKTLATISTLIILLTGYNTFKQTKISAEEAAYLMKNRPFEMTFDIENVDKKTHRLAVIMQPEEGAYYGSPFSTYFMNGLLNIKIPDNPNFQVMNNLKETPVSKPEYDSFAKDSVHWVREKTTYEQHLIVTNSADFNVTGTVSFVIEPACMRYEVDFIINQFDGELEVLKAETRLANIDSYSSK